MSGLVATFAFAFLSGLTACGGGGGGSASSSGGGGIPPTSTPITAMPATPTPTPTPKPTPTPAPAAFTGQVVDLASGSPIAGATVTIGTQPSGSTCTGYVQCGIPLAPTFTATTAADGSFSIPVTAGAYMIVVANGSRYAALHRTITETPAGLAYGAVKLAALTTDEQGMLAALNSDRATFAYPATGAVVIDEDAEEAARAWTTANAAGTQPPADPGSAFLIPYNSRSGVINGGWGSAWSSGLTWQSVLGTSTGWFSEKSNCPNNGDWRTCVLNPDGPIGNGHYVILAQDSVVWVGVSESPGPMPSSAGVLAGLNAYEVLVTDYGLTARAIPYSTYRQAR